MIMASNYKLTQFISSLEQYCATRELKTTRWDGGSKSTPNLIQVLTSAPKLLYVKESNIGEGFWGVNENQVDALEESGYEWWLVLLTGSGEAAYIVTEPQVVSAIKSSLWSRGKQDYKVHEGHELAAAMKITNYGALFQFLFG